MNLNDYPLWTALITPLHQDGSLDFSSLKTLVRQQERAKNGLLILGSTGEALNLSLEEKKSVLEYVIKLKPDTPIMVGVGGTHLPSTKEWVDYLESQNVQAYLMVTPLYAKPESYGQYYWFKELMDTSSRPVMLYNVPGRTGKALSYQAVQQLAEHPRLWAIKEASGSTEDFQKYRQAAPQARLYSGDDAMTPSFAPHGCLGLVSVASNAWPEATHLYTKLALKRELKEEEKEMWEECVNSLFQVSNPIPLKCLLHQRGEIQSATLKLPLCHEDLENPSQLIEADRKIQSWNQSL